MYKVIASNDNCIRLAVQRAKQEKRPLQKVPRGGGGNTEVPATVASEAKNTSKRYGHRRWAYTINLVTGDTEETEKIHLQNFANKFEWLQNPDNFEDSDVSYLMAVIEHVSNDHIQGYVEFFKEVNMRRIKHVFRCENMHLEPAQGDWRENRDYIFHTGKHANKEGLFWLPFEWGQHRGSGYRTDIETVRDAIKEGKTDLEISETPMINTQAKYDRFFTKLRNLHLKPRYLAQNPEVIVYYGETGTGKSKNAHEYMSQLDEPYWTKTMTGQWFDGYAGEKNMIIEEFKGSSKTDLPIEFLLQLLDRYPCRLPIKGSSIECQTNTFIICSNKHPADWYEGEKYNLNQLKRRITSIVHFKRQAFEKQLDWVEEEEA